MMDNYSGLRTNLTMLMDFMKLQWQMVILQMDIVTELLILICFFVMYQNDGGFGNYGRCTTTDRIF